MTDIPFHSPFIVGKELFYLAQAVLNQRLSGDGPFTKKCHKWLEEQFRANKTLLTHSCTAALEMAALLIDIQPGDEVIMPSYTFVSTANAFVLRGAKIRFVDIRADTLNLDETLIEEAIHETTKAIVPVHYAGVACDMDPIMEIANRHDLWVIEDAAQGVKSRYKEKYLGTIGHLGAYSFHETKNFMSGEGGALLINDERFVSRAEMIREKGTNRSAFFRGEVDKYTWVEVGSSYLPSELMAAFLYAQLEESEKITEKRSMIFNYYHSNLFDLEQDGKLRRPQIPDFATHTGHMYYILLNSLETRTKLIQDLRTHGIHSVFHYVPLHNSPMGLKHGVTTKLPVTEDLSSRVLRLPCYYELTTDEIDKVVDHLYQFL